MTKSTEKASRFKLPTRIRSMRRCPGDFAARMALIERIADLPGLETIERNDETAPKRVDIYIQRETSDRVANKKPGRRFCRLDFAGVTISGLKRWDRYQVLANGWGKLINERVCVFLPRDPAELEIVWGVVRQAYDRLLDPLDSESESEGIFTWDFPRFSRTSLQ